MSSENQEHGAESGTNYNLKWYEDFGAEISAEFGAEFGPHFGISSQTGELFGAEIGSEVGAEFYTATAGGAEDYVPGGEKGGEQGW